MADPKPPHVTVGTLAGFHTEAGTLYLGRVVDIEDSGWFARALMRPLFRVDDIGDGSVRRVDVSNVRWTAWVDAIHLTDAGPTDDAAAKDRVDTLARWLEAETITCLARCATLLDGPNHDLAKTGFERSARDLLHFIEHNHSADRPAEANP